MDAALVHARRGLLRSRVAIVLLLVVAAVCGVFVPAAAASSNDGLFGVNAGDLFKLPQSQWDAQLSQIAADGIQVVRGGAWWSDIEPSPPVAGQHNYYWGDVDQQVAALARHGLRWEPLLCFSPTWDSKVPGDYTAAPASASDFASFSAALAARYGSGGSFWREHPELPALPVTAYEIWNEQNAATYWHPAQSAPEDYADLYAAARSAIHQVDGAARVVVGGLGATAPGVIPADQFIQRMFARRPDLRGNVDAVAFHPYASDVQGVYANVAAFRHALDAAAGPGVPLELTEIGWSTVDVSEAQRAADLSAVATTLPRSDCGIDRLSAYDWIGPEQAANDREQWFGIENHDATPKPSATAYADAVQQMRGISGTPPAGTAAICNPNPPSHTRAATTTPRRAKKAKHRRSAKRTRTNRAQLNVQLRQDRRHPARLLLVARCSAGCRLRVAVLSLLHSASSSSNVRITQRSTRFTTRRQALSLNLARRLASKGTQVRVDVTATARNGQRATRSQTIRVR